MCDGGGGGRGARHRPDEVVLKLLEGGFDPAQATWQAGKLPLTVDKRSGVERIRLRLAGEGGTHLRDVEVPPGSLERGAEIDLPSTPR